MALVRGSRRDVATEKRARGPSLLAFNTCLFQETGLSELRGRGKKPPHFSSAALQTETEGKHGAARVSSE